MDKIKVGIQNSVMAFDDAFFGKKKMRRTGTCVDIDTQDGELTVKELKSIIDDFKIDFYVHHTFPSDDAVIDFLDKVKELNVPFIIGNEFGNISGPYAEGTNRYDVDLTKTKGLDANFMGLLYDEPEHLQIHPTVYKKEGPKYKHWVTEGVYSSYDAEKSIEMEMNKLVKKSNCDIFDENVFPVLNFISARAGINLCPKILKEHFQTIQLAICMGAAKEYGRKLGVCIDLWGMDIGPWFTRNWGFPGHSPEEFESALNLAYYLSPEFMFVENMDILVKRNNGNIEKTEYGKILKKFISSKKQELPYKYSDIICKIAVIHGDNGIISKQKKFLYGIEGLEACTSDYDLINIMHALNHCTTSKQALTQHFSEVTDFPRFKAKVKYPNINQFPLNHGFESECETFNHTLFHACNSVLVFDQKVDYDCIKESELVIFGGSFYEKKTIETLKECVRNGKKVLCNSVCADLVPGCIKIDDFENEKFYKEIEGYIGSPDEWVISFKNSKLKITCQENNKNKLLFRIEE